MSDENAVLSPKRDSLFTDNLSDEFNKLYGSLMESGQYFGTTSPISPESMTIYPCIPPPTLANLEVISEILRDPNLSFKYSRERWCRFLETVVCDDTSSPTWLGQLCLTFDVAEELESEEALDTLFVITKHILLASTVQLLIRIVQDDVFESILGILQYDPDVPMESHVNHRAFVKSEATFRQVMPIEDKSVVIRIHQNFRLQYIKDCVLARLLDDGGFLAFTQAIGYLNSTILTHLSSSDRFLEQVVQAAASAGDMNVLAFIHSVVHTARQLPPEERGSVMAQLSCDSVFEYLESTLQTPSSAAWSLAIEILVAVATTEPQSVRGRYVKHSAEDINLMTLLIRSLHQSTSESLSAQLGEVFRILMEPSFQADAYISLFYERDLLHRLAQPLVAPCATVLPFTLQVVLDLLTFCVCSHNYVAKAHFLRFGSLLKSIRAILTLAVPALSAKIVQLAAIRLVRAFFWQKDPLYFKHLSAFNIPCLVLQLLYASRPTAFIDGNMIYSATLEILTFLCVNSQLSVIEALCKPGTESENLVVLLAEDSTTKAHSELAHFMVATVERVRNQYLGSGGDDFDFNSRQSITSSRGRSMSPQPLLVPLRKRRMFDEPDEDEAYLLSEDEDDLIPKTPGASPDPPPRRDSLGEAAAAVPPPELQSGDGRKRMRFSSNKRGDDEGGEGGGGDH